MDPIVKTERQSSPSQALPPRSPDPPDLEISFDRDFRCCGLVLPSFPELLQHYQEVSPVLSTVFLEDYC